MNQAVIYLQAGPAKSKYKEVHAGVERPLGLHHTSYADCVGEEAGCDQTPFSQNQGSATSVV